MNQKGDAVVGQAEGRTVHRTGCGPAGTGSSSIAALELVFLSFLSPPFAFVALGSQTQNVEIKELW